MKSNKFLKYFIKIIEHIYSGYDKKQLEEKNILLAQADISLDFIRYSSIALMNMFFGFISMFFLSIIIFTLAPSFITLIFLILAPLTILIAIGFKYWYFPIYKLKSREKNIDLFLPYAINFISSMAIAGISPSEIF